MLQQSETGTSTHLHFHFLFFYSVHKRNGRRKRRSLGWSLEVRERLSVLFFFLPIIISHHSSFSFPPLCRSGLFLSIITHCSLARWSTINRQQNSFPEMQTLSPAWLYWSYSSPVKANRFFKIGREIQYVARLWGNTGLYCICVDWLIAPKW